MFLNMSARCGEPCDQQPEWGRQREATARPAIWEMQKMFYPVDIPGEAGWASKKGSNQ